MKKRILSFMMAVFMLLPLIPTFALPTSAAVSVTTIPSDAVSFNENKYYVYYIDEITTWDQAKEHCESLGGHLATISSQEENDFLHNYMTSLGYESAYFGFTDQKTEGVWEWVTGEDIVYTNWNYNEPNSETSAEDYGMFYYKYPTGKWNDGSFGKGTVSDGRAFICEWETASKDVYTGICGENLVYRLDVESGEMAFTGWGAMNDYNWNNNFAPWYNQKELIKSVFIDYDITHLGNFTFNGCKNLTSVTFEEGLKSIGTGAFELSNITQIIFPNGLETLGAQVFKGCEKLKSVYFPSSITEIVSNPFIDCDSIREIYVVKGSYAAEYFLSKSDLAPYVKYYSGIVNSLNSPVYETAEEKVLRQLGVDADNMLQNLSFGNHAIRGPYIEFLGIRFYLFEFEGKLTIDKGINIQVKVDKIKKTIQILGGFNAFDEDETISPEKNATLWKNQYQKVKSLYQNVLDGKVNTNELWQQSFNSLRKDLQTLDCDMLVKAKCYMALYAELNYESGEAKFSEGGILMSASIGTEFRTRLPGFFSWAYGTLGLKGSLDGKIGVDFNEYMSFFSKLNLKLTANLGIGAGAGHDKFWKAYIEGGLKGILSADITMVNGSFLEGLKDYDPIVITLSGQVYLKGALTTLLQGEKTWPIGEPVQLYPQNDISLMSARSMLSLNTEEAFANATPLPRDYLYTPMLFMLDDSDKIYSDKSVYDYNAPMITALSDGSLMLVWVDDLGTKSDINRTSLMYSIYNESEWSEPAEIFETGTYNGEPVIYNDGTNVHIAWSKAKKVFEDTAGLEDMLPEIEVYYTCFNGSDFSEPEMITSNSIMEASYVTTSSDSKTAIAWVENSDNDPYMETGTNTLYVRECINGVWSEKKVLASSDTPLGETNLFYLDDELNYAYAVLDSENNSSIYLNGELLCEGGYINYENGMLYYLSDSTVMVYDVATKETTETTLTGVQNFSIYNGNAYTLVNTGFTSEMYESINNDGVFTDWKQVTEFDKYIRNYSVTTDANGEPIYALNLVNVDEESENVYGLSELAVCGATEIDALTASAVYYDEDSVAPGAVLPLNIDIVNTGSTDITALTVEILDSNSNVISTETVTCDIPYGQEGTITCSYTLPSELSCHDITVRITGSETERIIDDNTVSTTIGYADLVLTASDVVRTEGGAETVITIKNIGYENTQNLILSVYDSDTPDVIIDTIECGDLATGDVYTYTYSIPEEYLTLEDKLTMHGLSFKAESDSEELNYANNSDKVVFGELTEYTVSIIEDNVLLDIIAVSEFADYELTKPYHKIEGWYTTSNFLEGTKITEIPEDISENLCLYVKWEVTDTADFMTFEGYQVREAGYNGLRSRFVVDLTKMPVLETDGLEVIEYGTIFASTDRLNSTGDEFAVTKNESGVYETVSYGKLITIMQNGSLVGKYISKDEENLVFACTVTNFTEANFDKEVSIRGYAVLADADGNEYVVYCDYPNEGYRSVSLAMICDALAESGQITAENNISYAHVIDFRKKLSNSDNEVHHDQIFGTFYN